MFEKDAQWVCSEKSSRYNGLRLLYIDARHKPAKLAPRKASNLFSIAWPSVSSLNSRQPFIKKDKTVRFPHEDLDPVAPSPAEQEDGAPSRIHVELILNDGA